MTVAIAVAGDGGDLLASEGDRGGLRVQTGILCLLVLSVQLLTPIPFYFRLASSMASGMAIAAAICVVVMVICWAIRVGGSHRGVLDMRAGGLVLIGAVLLLVIIHGVVADQLQRLSSGRFVASLGPLILLLGAALALSAAMRRATSSEINFLSWVSFWVMCLIIFLHLTGLQPGGARGEKSSFPYDEMSHFALAFGPVYLYRCAMSRRRLRRDFWIILGFALAIVLKSATLVAAAFIAAFICRRLLVIALLGAAVAVVGLGVELKYFTARADISNNSSNLSALVYLQGWEMLDDALVQTDGWGVGFQQLGVHGSGVSAATSIEELTGGADLNLTDGSFVLSKLGGEFGLIGLALVLGFTLLAFRSLLHLRSGRGPPVLTFARAIVVAYSIDMFVRGTGYFTESTLLFLGALLVLAPEGGLLRAGRGPRLQHLVVIR